MLAMHAMHHNVRELNIMCPQLDARASLLRQPFMRNWMKEERVAVGGEVIGEGQVERGSWKEEAG